MRFLSAFHTDVGTTKEVNQDAFCLKIAKTKRENIAFAVLCDGMGGLKNGELASALVVNAFSNWFDIQLPTQITSGLSAQTIGSQWKQLAIEQNQKIMEYGKANGISLGTTLSAILLINNQYYMIHVGDSRIYQIDDGIAQLTKDHTVVAHEVEQKRLTEAEAKSDKRKNVLLQCIGASKTVIPDFTSGTFSAETVFMLCSDGFRHEVEESEMFGLLAPRLLGNERVMEKTLVDLVELNKTRGEQDNITALLIKAIR